MYPPCQVVHHDQLSTLPSCPLCPMSRCSICPGIHLDPRFNVSTLPPAGPVIQLTNPHSISGQVFKLLNYILRQLRCCACQPLLVIPLFKLKLFVHLQRGVGNGNSNSGIGQSIQVRTSQKILCSTFVRFLAPVACKANVLIFNSKVFSVV